MAYTTSLPSSRFDIAARVASLVAEAKTSWKQYQVYRDTYAELQNLSMRELADLGMSPYNIKSVAYETAYGK